ncbi:MAG: FtsQ-type POTRA domain-containing protein [Candidatus Firestonebacteria bacterium]
MNRILYSKYRTKEAVNTRGRKLSLTAAGIATRRFPLSVFLKWGSIVFVGALLLAGAAYAYTALTSSEAFMLKKITVSGNRYVSKNEVLALAKLEQGKNLFSVSAREAEERIKRNLQFKKVSVCRVFPETLEIKVVERQPEAFLGEEKKLQVDQERVMFPSMKSQEIGKKLYVITGVKVNPNDFGRKSESAGLLQALEMIKLLEARKSPFMSGIVTIDVQSAEELRLLTDEGKQNYRIGAGNWEEKLDRLEQLLKNLNERCDLVQCVDLRFRDEAAVMFRK